jgi:hypothetical protein
MCNGLDVLSLPPGKACRRTQGLIGGELCRAGVALDLMDKGSGGVGEREVCIGRQRLDQRCLGPDLGGE